MTFTVWVSPYAVQAGRLLLPASSPWMIALRNLVPEGLATSRALY